MYEARMETVDLAFGRMFVSDIESPNMLANMVRNGSSVAQSDNGTEP